MYFAGIADIPLEEVFGIIKTEGGEILEQHPEIFLAVPLIGALFALYYLVRSIYGRRKLALENAIFIVICSIILFLMVASLLTVHFESLAHNKFLTVLLYLCFTSFPSFLCLHIWTQVSQKKVQYHTIALYFIVPVFVTALFARTLFTGAADTDVWHFFSAFHPIGYLSVAYIIYWFFITLKSLRLCLNVFYQMPKHMQGSTLLLISALIGMTIADAIALYFGTKACFLLFLLMLVFVINRAYSGFFRASASNVIATSRQFVFSNLGTQIFILSRKGRILEWNAPQDNYLINTVQPKYLQPYSDFRDKIIEAGHGLVSAHDPNVLTLTIDGIEHDILILRHPIAEGAKTFGELIEISEVTNLYSVLHQMEQISFVDQMTGLRNRNAYITRAQNIMKPDNLPLLIVVGDVNNLKMVNDKLGHVVGDRMLIDTANILKECAPEDAFLARIGGDEYVMLVTNAEEDFGDRYIAAVEEKCNTVFDEEYGRPNISIGWAVARSIIEDYNTTFEAADKFMYRRKKAYKEHANAGRRLSGMLPEDIQPIGDKVIPPEPVATDAPDKPDKPDKPDTPDAPGAPEATDAPDTPEATDAPVAPELITIEDLFPPT